MADVTLLIPHHKGKALLSPLFTSIDSMNIDPNTYKVMLVDNNSNDGSKEFVRKKFPQVEILELIDNLGFAPALNRGASECGTDWVCFLNNDIRVEANWLSELLGSVNRYPADCYASHILDWEGNETTFANGTINWFGKGFEEETLQHHTPYDVFFSCGCGMMVRRSVFLDLGGFDEDYFMIYEDIDFGWRLRLLGYKTVFVPSAKIMHNPHTSLKAIPYTQKALYYERNSLATLYKNLSPDTLGCILPLAIQETLLRAQAIGGIGIPVRYSSDGLAMMDAVSSFFESLPKWRDKREWVQARRKMSDQEIFTAFFSHPERIWAYHGEHYRRLYFPEVHQPIQTLFEKCTQLISGIQK